MKDTKIYDLIKKETRRQTLGIELIASENYASKHVRNVLSSVLTNKYSEGYPKARYYGGNEYIDEIEIIAQERAKKLFGVPFVNVQPYSGSPAVCMLQHVNPAILQWARSLLQVAILRMGIKCRPPRCFIIACNMGSAQNQAGSITTCLIMMKFAHWLKK